MKKILFATLFLFASVTATHADTKPLKEPVCDKPAKVQEILNGKGFFLLMNMLSDTGVTQSIWIGGQTAVIVATPAKSEQSCVVSMMQEVIYNSDTITGLAKAYESQSKKQKDI